MTTKPRTKSRRSAAAGANMLLTASALAATRGGWTLLAGQQQIAEAPADATLVSAPAQDTGADLPAIVPLATAPGAPTVPAIRQPLRQVAPAPLARTRSSR